LAAGPGIHGCICGCVGHLVVRAEVVNPLPHAELISQSSGFCVKLTEPLVARGLVPPELPQDELTVSNHVEWRPLMCLCCSEAFQRSAVFGLVVGSCGFGRRHRRRPNDGRCGGYSVRADNDCPAAARPCTTTLGLLDRTSPSDQIRDTRRQVHRSLTQVSTDPAPPSSPGPPPSHVSSTSIL
jgi:hypothetical protein